MCEDVGFAVHIACPHAGAVDLDSNGIEVRKCRVGCSNRMSACKRNGSRFTRYRFAKAHGFLFTLHVRI